MTEEFKDIPNYEGLYQVSNLGNVKSLKLGKETILKGGLGSNGYRNIVLVKNQKYNGFSVHQLVAICFLNHTPNKQKLVVNHKDFDKLNNNLNNLEIITTRENTNQKHFKNTSKYTGVCWSKLDKKWKSAIRFNGKKIHLGYFKTEEEAKEYYDNALKSINNGKEIKVKKGNYSSKYKGVSWMKKNNKWVSSIKINGKQIYLGLFKNELEASNAYQNKLKTLNN